MSKDAWSARTFWFQLWGREGRLWNNVNWDQVFLQQRLTAGSLVSLLVLNVSGSRLLRDPTSEESSLILHTDCVLHCVISLFSPLSLLSWRCTGCVEHPKAICSNKMPQFVLITGLHSRTSRLLFIIRDAFDLGFAAPSITHHVHPHCQGHFFNKTWVFMLLIVMIKCHRYEL